MIWRKLFVCLLDMNRKEIKMPKKKVLRVIILALIVMWMMMTFQFSNQNGETSSNLSREVASIFVSTEEQIDTIEFGIRKIAHLTEYACGGVLLFGLFLTYSFSNKKRMLYALLVGMEYAAVDEIHQLFVAGRSGQVKDVVIDSIGVFIGICLAMLVYKMALKIYKRKDGVFHKQE